LNCHEHGSGAWLPRFAGAPASMFSELGLAGGVSPASLKSVMPIWMTLSMSTFVRRHW
jgi:hypothetical protein